MSAVGHDLEAELFEAVGDVVRDYEGGYLPALPSLERLANAMHEIDPPDEAIYS